ncbi:hypothetical protein [Chitinophaga arvensicola]|uniref:Uncharacterized protein n=1 Tax=Chitinophaga arvensicola TaxID=29529 RepID=A0A1I0SAK9_9BACT|nr:hypothetical protein [Chitinophaga arvensicola]SEW53344.1 hypothetical protein SAMN04488122_5425 [Chitinophaga arvensicola]
MIKKIGLLGLLFIPFIYSNAQQYKFTIRETMANTSDEFLGDGNLTVDNNQQIKGTIRWSIVSIDKKGLYYYKDKMNATATEYVSGSYAPDSKTFSFSGYKKDDAAAIIILDVYAINLLDNTRFSGKTRGTGKWDGIINGKYSAVALPPVASVPDKAPNTKIADKPVSAPIADKQPAEVEKTLSETEMIALNKKKYAAIVKLMKSKYPVPLNKKSLAPVEYTERVEKTKKIRNIVPAYDGQGNVTTAEVEDEKSYWEDEQRRGLKNITNKTITVTGLERERFEKGEWFYTDISFTLAPGEVMRDRVIQSFYEPGDDWLSDIYFYNIK